MPPHSDMVNFLLTCHLGVVVPEDRRSSSRLPGNAARGVGEASSRRRCRRPSSTRPSTTRRASASCCSSTSFIPSSAEERGALADFELRRRADEAAFWGGGDDRAAPGGDDAASLFAEAARLRREAAEAERDAARPPGAAPRRRTFSTDVSRPRQNAAVVAPRGRSAPRRAAQKRTTCYGRGSPCLRRSWKGWRGICSWERERPWRRSSIGSRRASSWTRHS